LVSHFNGLPFFRPEERRTSGGRLTLDHRFQGVLGEAVREFWFMSEGVQLFAIEDGSGKPVVMLHGGLANNLAALRIVSPLASRFQVIAPDLRASGKSIDASPLTWDRLADDVTALLDHLGARRAVVGGVSSGAGVAIRFALRHCERIAGLVLVTPLYGGEDRGLTTHQTTTFKKMDEVGSRAPQEGIQVLYPLYENLPPPIRERALAVVNTFDRRSVAETTRFLASGAQPFASTADLRSIGAPTLLVPGNDPLHPAEISAQYAAAISNCTVYRPQTPDASGSIAEFCEQRAAW
jgi:pimeloyl-ACP methyl ester carboxylesterase